MKAGNDKKPDGKRKTVNLPASHHKRNKLARKHTSTIADTFDDESDDVVSAASNATDADKHDILSDAAKAALLVAVLAAISSNKDTWTDTLQSVYSDAAGTAAQGILDALPSDFPLPSDFKPTAADDSSQLADWASAGADSITSTTADRMQSVMDGLPDSATLDDITKSLKDTYQTWQGAQDGGDPDACRSSNIAGDTVTAGWGFGESDTVGALLGAVDGADGEQTWNTVGDDHVRPSHADADGQTAAPGDTFSVGGDELHFPGDPDGSDEETANCRCYLTSSITYTPMDDDSEKAARIARMAKRHRRDSYREFMEILT